MAFKVSGDDMVGARVDSWRAIVDGNPTEDFLYVAFCESCGWVGDKKFSQIVTKEAAIQHDKIKHSRKSLKVEKVKS